MEGKSLSNKAPGNWRSDRCCALRESVTESGERSFLDGGEKNPRSEVVQQAEFAPSRLRNSTPSLSGLESGIRDVALHRFLSGFKLEL